MVSKKARSLKKLQRPKPNQYTPRAYILIVCEDGKTSPNYFKEFCKEEQLSSAEIEVIGEECGSAPISVVDCAKEKRNERKRASKHDPDSKCFDSIWCVMDVEAPIQHESLDRAYNKAIDNGFKIILSNPNFEYWLLLHFEKSSSPYQESCKVESNLKKYITNYAKGSDDIYNKISANTSIAISNAESALKSKNCSEDLRNCNPSTHVQRLVQFLQNVASQQPKLVKSND